MEGPRARVHRSFPNPGLQRGARSLNPQWGPLGLPGVGVHLLPPGNEKGDLLLPSWVAILEAPTSRDSKGNVCRGAPQVTSQQLFKS